MTLLIGGPVALVAIWGESYLASMGFVILTLVLAQIIAAAGFGQYYPWSVPSLYSGAGGDYKENLNRLSYTLVILMGIIGYVATLLYLNRSDQTK